MADQNKINSCTCEFCNTEFSNEKTLKTHVKYCPKKHKIQDKPITPEVITASETKKAQHKDFTPSNNKPDSNNTALQEKNKNIISPNIKYAYSESITGLTFTPDRKNIISCALNNIIKIWTSHDGKLKETITGNAKTFHSMAITPDGTKLIVGGGDGKIYIYNTIDYKLESSTTAHTSPITSLVISNDGQTLASCTSTIDDADSNVDFKSILENTKYAIIWSINDCVIKKVKKIGPFQSPVHHLCFTADSKTIVIAAGNELKAFTLPQCSELISFKKNSIFSSNNESPHKFGARRIIILDKQKLMISGPQNIALWNLSDGSLKNEITHNYMDTLFILLSSASIFAVTSYNRIDFYNNMSPVSNIKSITLESACIQALTSSKDDKFIAAGTNMGEIILLNYDIENMSPKFLIDPNVSAPKTNSNCFIATVLFGKESWELFVLRRFRDEILMKYILGKIFVALYYMIGPHIASVIRFFPIIIKAMQFILRPIINILAKSLLIAH